MEKENPDLDEVQRRPILRYYNVFNIDQCAGIPKEKLPPIPERINNPIEECDKIIEGMPKRPEIRHKMNQAYYQKRDDYINMPKKQMFKSSEGYYGTLFHELIHSTGHKDRLDRGELMMGRGFKIEDYAVEELTAEMGASYLKSYAGISNDQHENSAAYIESWLTKLKKDKKFVVYASSQAQKATDFILNLRNEEKELEVAEVKEEPEIPIKNSLTISRRSSKRFVFFSTEENPIIAVIKNPVFWTVVVFVSGVAFTLGSYFEKAKFDKDKIEMYENNKNLSNRYDSLRREHVRLKIRNDSLRTIIPNRNHP